MQTCLLHSIPISSNAKLLALQGVSCFKMLTKGISEGKTHPYRLATVTITVDFWWFLTVLFNGP